MASPAPPRVAPGSLRDIGLLNWALCGAIARGAGVRDAHLFRTLARRRGLFRAWLLFAARLMPRGSLPRADTELAILRVAHVRGCAYERDHHVRLALRAGLRADDLARVEAGPDAPGWTPERRALLRAVDALLHDHALDDATFDALRACYDEARVVEVCLLVGHYDMLATTIAALRIERDVVSATTTTTEGP